MSKFTLGQRQFPTLGLRSQQPKNYVGPTLSCYLGIQQNFDSKYINMLTVPSKLNAKVDKPCIMIMSDMVVNPIE